MDESTMSSFRSSEQAAFQKYYDNLLYVIDDPVQLAELLLTEGVIRSETKDSIISDEDEEHATRSLLDDVLYSLEHNPDGGKTIQSLRIAFEKASLNTYYIDRMEEFIVGECTISLKLEYLRWG